MALACFSEARVLEELTLAPSAVSDHDPQRLPVPHESWNLRVAQERFFPDCHIQLETLSALVRLLPSACWPKSFAPKFAIDNVLERCHRLSKFVQVYS